MWLHLCIWVVALSAGPAWPQWELVVGREGHSYLAIQDSVAFVNGAPDSLWTWAVTPGENLMANALCAGRADFGLGHGAYPRFFAGNDCRVPPRSNRGTSNCRWRPGDGF